jgi:ABC-type multidrug transport system permease subunit
MPKPILQLLLLQWRAFYREPGLLFWALVFPILLSGLLGLAYARKKPAPLPIVLCVESPEEAHSLASLAASLTPDPRLETLILPRAAAELQLKRGKAVLAVNSPADAQARRYLLDSTNPEAELALLHARAWLSGQKSPEDTLPLDTRGGRYIDFLMPGLLAFSVINSCLWGVAWTLIDYRKKKFMRRMVATPMSRFDFFAALLLGRLVLITVEGGVLLLFAWGVFGFGIQGQAGAFALTMASGVLAFFGLGCLIASRTSNSEVGAGLINATTMPMMLVSGIFFSYERFPAFLQPILRLFPPTMMVDTLRAIANEGADLSRAWPACIALGLMGVFCLGLTSRIFRWH